MTEQDQIKALAELDQPQFDWLEHTYDGKRCICAFKRGEFYGPATNYLTSYDAIIPLIQKQNMRVKDTVAGILWNNTAEHQFDKTHAQLAEALLRATNLWKK